MCGIYFHSIIAIYWITCGHLIFAIILRMTYQVSFCKLRWVIIILLPTLLGLFYCSFHLDLFSNNNRRDGMGRREALHDSFHDGLSLVKASCRQNDIRTLSQRAVPSSMFLYDPGSRLLMCKTAKHGSTTWAGYFVSIFQNG